jgi:hypothetical protein
VPASGLNLLVGFFLVRAVPRLPGCGPQLVQDGLAHHADQAVTGRDDDPGGRGDLIGGGVQATVKLIRSGWPWGSVSTAFTAIRMIVW